MIEQETLELIKRQIESKKEILASEGYMIWSEIFHSRSSYLIFLENNRSTRLCINYLNTVDIFVLPEEIRWRKQRKLVKEVHNLVSSGLSFKDHLNFRNNYTPTMGKINIVPFFKLLRNFLIHNDIFPLTSRREWKADANIRVYQAMNKTKFLDFLERKSNLKPENEEGQAVQEASHLRNTIEFVKRLPALIEIEPFFSDFSNHINLYYHKWIKYKVSKNKSILKEFIKQMEEYHKIGNDILSQVQMRYLKLLLNKKNWRRPEHELIFKLMLKQPLITK